MTEKKKTDAPEAVLVDAVISRPFDIGVTDRLAVVKNIADNARLFCVLLVVINLVAANPRLAVLAAVPVGLSCIVDQLPARVSRYVSLAVYAFTAGIALATLVSVW